MNTMQFEFDAVVAHLYAQGRQATQGYQCKYRSPDGAMCAVGCRIPDDKYSPEMEGLAADLLVADFDDVLPPEIVEYEDLFVALQEVHDETRTDFDTKGFNMTELGERLTDVAEMFGLTFTAPKQGE